MKKGAAYGIGSLGSHGAIPTQFSTFSVGLGKGLREPVAPYREAYVFGAELNAPNADGWNYRPDIVDPAIIYDLTGMAINHEVVVQAITFWDLTIGGTAKIEWTRLSDNVVVYTHNYTIPSPQSQGYTSWLWYYVYSYIGYVAHEINANGTYQVRCYFNNQILSSTPFSVIGIPAPPIMRRWVLTKTASSSILKGDLPQMGEIVKTQIEIPSNQLRDVPASNIPMNIAAKPHTFVRNLTSIGRRMETRTAIVDPDGITLSDLFVDSIANVASGATGEIYSLTRTFQVNKPGVWKYYTTLLVDNIATDNEGTAESPATMFTVNAPTGEITAKELRVGGGQRISIPAGDVPLNSVGVVFITCKNTSVGNTKFLIRITIKAGTVVIKEQTLESGYISPQSSAVFTTDDFNFTNTGPYTIAFDLYALPNNVVPIFSQAATKLCNDVTSGHTDEANVHAISIAGWAKAGGVISKSLVNLIPGDRLTVRVSVNYDSMVADSTREGTYVQMTYRNMIPPYNHAVVGSTVIHQIPLPASSGAIRNEIYDFEITVSSSVESGQYDLEFALPGIVGNDFIVNTYDTTPSMIRISSGAGGGTAILPSDALSIESWSVNSGAFLTTPVALTIGDVLHVKVGIKYTSVADDVAVTKVGISYTTLGVIRHIDSTFVQKSVALPMANVLTTAHETFDIPILGGAAGGLYNGSYLISARIPSPIPGWADDTEAILTMSAANNDEPPDIPLFGDIGNLVMMMIVMMMMSLMMENTRDLYEPVGTPPRPKPVTEAVVKGAKTAAKYGGRVVKKVIEYYADEGEEGEIE